MSIKVENCSTMVLASGTSSWFGSGWLATMVGWPTVTNARLASCSITLPAASVTPGWMVATKSVSSGSRSSGVKTRVLAFQLKAPSTPGSIRKAVSALAWSTPSEKTTWMLVVVSATSSSDDRWWVRPKRSTSGARPSTLVATKRIPPSTTRPMANATKLRRIEPRDTAA